MPQLIRRVATTSALLLLLVVPCVQAAPHRGGAQPSRQRAAATSPVRSLLQAVWSLWTAGWSAVAEGTDEGGSLDSIGARIDGNGAVDLSVAWSDEGGDAGSRIDGNGAL